MVEMAGQASRLAQDAVRIDFQTDPGRYRHWNLAVEGDIATLTMDVDENGGLFEGYLLKLNSYDLGVDIELSDALQRLRFEYPAVKSVLMRSAKPRVFCAGANIRMLAGASHAHKVNFCKFTNETRNNIEDASAHSGQKFVCVVNGTAAGGGYELALTADHIILVDDGSSSVSLPEVPLLAVLPGTGGLTRVVDKRRVRRDHADVFCTIEEGIKGKRAKQWRLVDELAPPSKLEERVAIAAGEQAGLSRKTAPAKGIALTPLSRKFSDDGVAYDYVNVEIDRARRLATITVKGPKDAPPQTVDAMVTQGADFWPLRVARELDDAILHLRNNEFEIGVLLFRTEGDGNRVLAFDHFLDTNKTHWLAHEVLHFWKRVLKRIDVTSRTLVALIEPGSCFAGTLAEIALACDRSYMLVGTLNGENRNGENRSAAALMLSAANFNCYPMGNGLTRLESRFLGDPSHVAALNQRVGEALEAQDAEEAGLVTFALDDIDWSDEVRLFLEERTSYSPDCLTGLEANLRFVGPETMETKIFARLTAWQNWIFQRPNAVGEEGALGRYGSGQKPKYDMTRV
jgi:benzoyl-CoA-dihydrodiol lyase